MFCTVIDFLKESRYLESTFYPFLISVIIFTHLVFYFFIIVTILEKNNKLRSFRLRNQPDVTVFQNTLLVIWLTVVQ